MRRKSVGSVTTFLVSATLLSACGSPDADQNSKTATSDAETLKKQAEIERHTRKVSELRVGDSWGKLIEAGEKEMKEKQYDEAEPLLMRAFQETSIFKNKADRLSRTLIDLGAVHLAQGKVAIAEFEFKRAIDICQRQLMAKSAPSDAGGDKAAGKLKVIAKKDNQDDPFAEEQSTKKEDQAEAAKAAETNRLADAYFCLGTALGKQGKFEEARANFSQALLAYAARPTLKHLDAPWLKNELDYFDRTENSPDKAQAFYKQLSQKLEKSSSWVTALCNQRAAAVKDMKAATAAAPDKEKATQAASEDAAKDKQ